jgi:hypothetical protein
MSTRVFGLCALCLGLGLPAAAQDGASPSVLLKASGPRSPLAEACEMTLNRSLLQAGLEVLAPPEGAQEGAAAGADLVISYQLMEQADGGRKSLRLSLEARSSASAEIVGSAVEVSPAFAGGPGQAMRALEAVCETGGANIAKQLQAPRRDATQEDRPIRVIAKNGPKNLDMALHSALRKACAQAHLRRSDASEVHFSCECKADPSALAAALDETLRAGFPGAKYVFGAKERDLILIVFTP